MATYHVTSPSGDQYVINNTDDGKAQQAAKDLADSFGPATSTMGAAGRGALDALPFGDKAAAALQGAVSGGSSDQYLKQLDQLIAADKEQHPIAHGAGEVAGTVAPFAIPGVGEALGAESLAGRAAIGAGIGGLQGASNNRDSSSLLSDVAKGAASGAVLNPAVGAIGEGLSGLLRGGTSRLSQAITSEGDAAHVIPSIPETAAIKNPVQSEVSSPALTSNDLLDINDKTARVSAASAPASSAPVSLPKLDSSTPESAMQQDLTVGRQKQSLFPSVEELKAEILAGQLGGSPRQLRSLPGKDPVQTLNNMYDVIRRNSTSDNPLISGLDRYSDRLQKFNTLHTNSGKSIGDFVQSVGTPPISTQSITDQLQGSLKFPNPDQSAQMKAVVDSLDKYSAADGTPGQISFKRLQQLKTYLGNEAFTGQGNPVLQSAYHVVDHTQDNILEGLGKTVNTPAFDQAKESYQMTSRAIPMLKMATARSLAKGYSSFGTPLAALVTGHPVAALGAIIKEPLQRMIGATAFNAGDLSSSFPTTLAAKTGRV